MRAVNLIVSPSAAEVASIRRRLPDRTNPIDPTTHPRGNSFTRSLTHFLLLPVHYPIAPSAGQNSRMNASPTRLALLCCASTMTGR